MKNTIMCCISCILPCGSLDVVRVIQPDGRVLEIRHAVCSADVLQDYPNHVLCRPPSSAGGRGLPVPQEDELRRGEIYFLVPVAAVAALVARRRRKKREVEGTVVAGERTRLLSEDPYLSGVLEENATAGLRERRRRGRVAVCRPHLESISESDVFGEL